MTAELLPPINQEAALKLSADIDELLSQISAHEIRLTRSYARLGSFLREVKLQQYWIVYGYDRFSSYLEVIRKKIDRRRSQVYAILSVAETLLPYLSEEELETIGMAKAHELRRLVKGGLRPDTVLGDYPYTPEEGPVRLMDFAARPGTTAAQVRVEVNKLLHQEEQPQGFWFDLGGCYFLPDEKKEWERAVELGKRVAEVDTNESEHAQLKEALLAMARECTSSWAEEIENE